MTLSEYFADKWFVILIGVTSCMLAFGVVNVLLHIGLRHRPTPLRVVAGSLLMSALFNAPLFVLDFFTYPAMLGTPIYSILMYPMPLYLIPYYWIMRRIFGFTGTEVMLSIESMLIGQYVVMLLFMAATDIWTTLLDAPAPYPLPFRVDLASMVTTNAIMWTVTALYARLLKRTHQYNAPPMGYERRMGRHVLVTLLSSCGYYALLVFANIFVMSDYRSILDINRSIIYIALIGMLAYRFIYVQRDNWIRIVEWERQQTHRYIDSLIRTTAELRGIKHDINNILQVYEGYIQSENMEGLRAYHRAVMNTTAHASDSLALLEALRDRTAIHTLINLKIGQAQGAGVGIRVLDVGHLCDVALNDLDLCRVLGNLLDNAIEAAARSEGKLVRVACERGADTVRVSVANGTEAPVDVARVLEGGRSSKPCGGYGVLAVREILERDARCGIGGAYADREMTVWVDFPVREDRWRRMGMAAEG